MFGLKGSQEREEEGKGSRYTAKNGLSFLLETALQILSISTYQAEPQRIHFTANRYHFNRASTQLTQSLANSVKLKLKLIWWKWKQPNQISSYGSGQTKLPILKSLQTCVVGSGKNIASLVKAKLTLRLCLCLPFTLNQMSSVVECSGLPYQVNVRRLLRMISTLTGHLKLYAVGRKTRRNPQQKQIVLL